MCALTTICPNIWNKCIPYNDTWINEGSLTNSEIDNYSSTCHQDYQGDYSTCLGENIIGKKNWVSVDDCASHAQIKRDAEIQAIKNNVNNINNYKSGAEVREKELENANVAFREFSGKCFVYKSFGEQDTLKQKNNTTIRDSYRLV